MTGKCVFQTHVNMHVEEAGGSLSIYISRFSIQGEGQSVTMKPVLPWKVPMGQEKAALSTAQDSLSGSAFQQSNLVCQGAGLWETFDYLFRN